MDLAIKCVKCAHAGDVQLVNNEVDVLKAANSWSHCVGFIGLFYEPWTGRHGESRGLSYHIAMPCALPLPLKPAAFLVGPVAGSLTFGLRPRLAACASIGFMARLHGSSVDCMLHCVSGVPSFQQLAEHLLRLPRCRAD